MNDIVLNAIRFAREAHAGQVRRLPGGGEEPYFLHPVRVMAYAATFGIPLDGETAAVAVLHDVIEDTKYTWEDIARRFGKFVADGVQMLTDPKPSAGNRKARKKMTRERLATAPDYIKLIKLCDNLDNLRSMSEDTHPRRFLRLCVKEMRELGEVIGPRFPKVRAEVEKAMDSLLASIEYELEPGDPSQMKTPIIIEEARKRGIPVIDIPLSEPESDKK